MASVRPLTDLSLRDLWREVKDPARLWGDLSQQAVRTVKNLLENRMHDELADYLHARAMSASPTRAAIAPGSIRAT